MNGLRAFCAALCVFATSACYNADRQVPDCRRIFREHLSDYSDHVPGFASFDRELQYRIFICDNQYVHPGGGAGTMEELGRQGEPTAVFLAEKLAASEDSGTTTDILMVYLRMSQNGTYDVGANTEIMRLLERKIPLIPYRESRELAEQNLAEIRQRSRTDGEPGTQPE